ncbi:hypothetical protein G9A89_010155 [Geosiphon pyriformis]|nr:hypothetical protein G9A89_010155 [Geosiphon pyriformis]
MQNQFLTIGIKILVIKMKASNTFLGKLPFSTQQRGISSVTRPSPNPLKNQSKAVELANSSSQQKRNRIKPSQLDTPSAAPEGTILTGLNYMKDGSDPIAKPDHEYPDWLWDLLDPVKQAASANDPLSRSYHRRIRLHNIRNANFDKNKKK